MSNNSLIYPKNSNHITVDGPVGKLECLEITPETNSYVGVVLIIHPDPKGGGTFTNKTIQTIAKSYNMKGYIAYCPNLRGVGGSEGIHDMGLGEVQDALAVYQYIQNQHPNLRIDLAGFSFGCAVISQLALSVDHAQLILVAPAVTRYQVTVPDVEKTWVIHGEEDEVIPLVEVISWSRQFMIVIGVMPNTGHFFHGKLINLQKYLLKIIK